MLVKIGGMDFVVLSNTINICCLISSTKDMLALPQGQATLQWSMDPKLLVVLGFANEQGRMAFC